MCSVTAPCPSGFVAPPVFCLSATPSPWSPFGLVSSWSCVPPVDSMSSATSHTHNNPNINDFAAHTPIRWRTSNPLQNPSRNPPFILTPTAPTVASSATFWCPNGGKKLNNFIAKCPHWQSIGSRHIVSFCPSPESCAQRIASATACVCVSQVSHCVVSAESPSSPPPSPRDHARSAARQKLVATSLRAGKCAFAVPPLGNDGAR